MICLIEDIYKNIINIIKDHNNRDILNKDINNIVNMFNPTFLLDLINKQHNNLQYKYKI